MAQAPTPEESARHILSVFAARQSRAGDALRANNLMMAFTGDWRASDRDAGLKYAEENGWLTLGPSGGIVLTDAGFAEM